MEAEIDVCGVFLGRKRKGIKEDKKNKGRIDIET